VIVLSHFSSCSVHLRSFREDCETSTYCGSRTRSKIRDCRLLLATFSFLASSRSNFFHRSPAIMFTRPVRGMDRSSLQSPLAPTRGLFKKMLLVPSPPLSSSALLLVVSPSGCFNVALRALTIWIDPPNYAVLSFGHLKLYPFPGGSGDPPFSLVTRRFFRLHLLPCCHHSPASFPASPFSVYFLQTFL